MRYNRFKKVIRLKVIKRYLKKKLFFNIYERFYNIANESSRKFK